MRRRGFIGGLLAMSAVVMARPHLLVPDSEHPEAPGVEVTFGVSVVLSSFVGTRFTATVTGRELIKVLSRQLSLKMAENGMEYVPGSVLVRQSDEQSGRIVLMASAGGRRLSRSNSRVRVLTDELMRRELLDLTPLAEAA